MVKLAQWLEAVGKTPEEFAPEIEVRPWTVKRYLSGERTPRKKQMRLIRLKTGGEVTANDFDDDVQPAPPRRRQRQRRSSVSRRELITSA